MARKKTKGAKRGPKSNLKDQRLKEVIAYIKKRKRLPPQTSKLGTACAGYRHRDRDFKKKTDAALKSSGGILQREAAITKRKEIIAYIRRSKRLPSPRDPLGAACCRFRFHDSKFKRDTDAALRKSGGVLQRDAAIKKRKEIIAYVKKTKKLPSQRTSLGSACANYRATDPKFKKEVAKYLKKKKKK